MSTRSIIEINHDYIDQLLERGHISKELHAMLSSTTMREMTLINGITYLMERHHSNGFAVKVEYII